MTPTSAVHVAVALLATPPAAGHLLLCRRHEGIVELPERVSRP